MGRLSISPVVKLISSQFIASPFSFLAIICTNSKVFGFKMLKKLLFTIIVLNIVYSYGQDCPTLTSPLNGDINVSVNTTITWQNIVGVTGYIISIGTTDGGTDIILSLIHI